MLSIDHTVLVMLDVQGKLAQLMFDRARLFATQRKLLQAARRLEIPMVWLEQNPGRMGVTIPELSELMSGITPIAKMSFSACGAPEFLQQLDVQGRSQVLLFGIEAHICIQQTAADLIQRGFHVEVPEDAVSSRTPANKETGLKKIEAAGAALTSVETALFELLRTADHPAFKDILALVK
jgi:nicotinamidase-related amidase